MTARGKDTFTKHSLLISMLVLHSLSQNFSYVLPCNKIPQHRLGMTKTKQTNQQQQQKPPTSKQLDISGENQTKPNQTKLKQNTTEYLLITAKL